MSKEQTRCTGKIIYKTHGHALRKAKAIGKRKNVHIRVYQCPHCGYYHHTSINKELNRQLKRLRGGGRKPRKRR